MYDRQDFYASARFVLAYLLPCGMLGLVFGFVFGLIFVWKGVNDGDQLMLWGGVVATALAPFFVAFFSSIISLLAALLSGFVFFFFAPLFRRVDTRSRRLLLVVTGALCGLLGGSVGFGVWPRGSLVDYGSVAVVTTALGIAAGLAYPYVPPLTDTANGD